MSGPSKIVGGGASDGVMELPRHELLLLRALDGEATAEERAELRGWADAEPRLAAWEALRSELRAALRYDGPVDVAADVLAALDEESWSPIGAELRAAFSVDLADVVLAALPGEVVPLSGAPDGWDDTSALVRGALTPAHAAPAVADEVLAAIGNLDAPAGWDRTSEALRAALTDAAAVAALDVWPEVAAHLDALPHDAAPEAWDATARALHGALTPAGSIDVAPAVMEGIATRGTLRVIRGGAGPVGESAEGLASAERGSGGARRRFALVAATACALAAAALLAVRVGTPTEAPGASVAAVEAGAVAASPVARPLAERNDATVEDLTTAGTVTAQVMQFEEGGPTIIFVNEGET